MKIYYVYDLYEVMSSSASTTIKYPLRKPKNNAKKTLMANAM